MAAEQRKLDVVDLALRPHTLDEYVGQERIKRLIRQAVQAAKMQNRVLGHMLLAGGPGLGKTSLAYIMANELGVNIRETTGPAIEHAGDLAAIIADLDRGDILFIDEIHRLRTVIEEILYPAMEDYKLPIVIGKGPNARTIKLNVQPFTLIGATTRTGLLSAPLRDRFSQLFQLEYYTPKELAFIVTRSAELLGVKIDPKATDEIARRSRGTPRIANRLLKAVRDYAVVHKHKVATPETVLNQLELMEVDHGGLDVMDRSILLTLIDKFNGGPVGIDTIATIVGEEKTTVEEVYEPFLLKGGYLARTVRGRMATPLAYKHLGRLVAKRAA